MLYQCGLPDKRKEREKRREGKRTKDTRRDERKEERKKREISIYEEKQKKEELTKANVADCIS